MCADVFREQYVLGHQIGSGTFGLVYAGKDRYTGAPVALKQIEAEDGEAPLEVQVLAKVKHHAIAPHHRLFRAVSPSSKGSCDRIPRARV